MKFYPLLLLTWFRMNSAHAEHCSCSGKVCTIESDCDRGSNDIKSIPLTSVEGCKQSCEALPACTAFAAANDCWLKHSPGKKVYLKGATCGMCDGGQSTKRDPSRGARWRNTLLGGVERIQQLYPGRIEVFGDNAEPILTYDKDPGMVVMAAAEYGEGRIILFSKDTFLKRFLDWTNNQNFGSKDSQKLWLNVIMWLTKSWATKSVRVKDVRSIDLNRYEPSPGEILTWSGDKDISASSLTSLLTAVKKGAPIFCAINTWAVDNLQQKSISKFVLNFGLKFSSDMASDGETWISQNKASESHALDLLNQIDRPESIVSYDHFRKSLKGLINSRQDMGCCIDNMLSSAYRKLGGSLKVPRMNQPVTRKKDKLKMVIAELQREVPGSRREVLTGLDFFPGIPQPTSSHRIVNIRVDFKAVVRGVFETGYYALPGQAVKIDVLESRGESLDSWRVQIGAHCDDVSDRRKEWRRWPNICRRVQLENREKSITVNNPFGGGVYVWYTGKPSTSGVDISLKIHGVVMAPLLEGYWPASVRAWPGRRIVPGPWADLVGKFITITLPAEGARKMSNPASFIQHFDNIVKQFHYLRGTNPHRSQRQWFVLDVTSTIGLLHSGYPIVGGIMNAMDKMPPIDYWAWYHEIGHNMQKREWTFDKQTEVTCNIFTLYGTMIVDRKTNLNKKKHHYAKAKRYVARTCTVPYERHDDSTGLLAHYQLIENFGFGAYKEVFRRFEKLTKWEKPKDNDAKINQWVKIFSEVVGYSIAPFYEFWCYPVSQSVKSSLRSLSPWLPDDEITRSAPQKVAAAKAAYPGLRRNKKLYNFRGSDCFRCGSETIPGRTKVQEVS